MKGFKSNLEEDTLENKNFRKVLYTSQHLQLVLMNIKAGGDIGEEIHLKNDQFFRFESGEGKCIIDGNEYIVNGGDGIIVPAGAKHNIINTGKHELQMYTIYGPPNHQNGTIRGTREDAEKNDEHFDGITSE
jgi:mannose-6-phosphate isomerase-like protein (cupin superfamily)